MLGNNWQEKRFSVALNLTPQGQENYDRIFDEYCKCPMPALAGLLDKKGRMQCINCRKPIRRIEE